MGTPPKKLFGVRGGGRSASVSGKPGMGQSRKTTYIAFFNRVATAPANGRGEARETLAIQ